MGNTKDTGFLRNLISYDASGNIVLPANLTVTGSLLANGGGSYATQSYVTTQISNLVNAAPGALDTLNELAAALGNDANFSTTVTNSLASKQAALNGTGFVKISGTTISYDTSTYLTTASATSTYLPLAGGTLTGTLTISSSYPRIDLTDTDNNSDYSIINADGSFTIYDNTNASNRFVITASGAATFSSSITAASLNLGSAYGLPKIYLYDDGTYVNGFGIYANEFRNFFDTIDASGSRMTWGKQTRVGVFTELMRLTKDGYVGIGVNNPIDKLHIAASDSNGILLTGGTNGRKILLSSSSLNFYTTTAPAGYAMGSYILKGSDGSLLATIGGAYGSQDSVTYTFYGGAAYNDAAMYIAGKSIGIGISAPARTLHVMGQAAFDMTSTGVVIQSNGTVSEIVSYKQTGSTYADLHLRGANLGIVINGSNGNVGIGTTTTTWKLSVANEMVVGAHGGNDYTYISGGSGYGSVIRNYYATGTINNEFRGNGNNYVNLGYGSFGIGTSNPIAKLHVSGGKIIHTSDDGGYGQFQINSSTTSTEATILLSNGGSGVNNGNYTNVGVIGMGAYGGARDTLIIGTGYNAGTMFMKNGTTTFSGNVINSSNYKGLTFIQLPTCIGWSTSVTNNTQTTISTTGLGLPAGVKAISVVGWYHIRNYGAASGQGDHATAWFGISNDQTPFPWAGTNGGYPYDSNTFTRADYGSFVMEHDGDSSIAVGSSAGPHYYGSWHNGIINVNSNGTIYCNLASGYSGGTHYFALYIQGYWI